MQISKVETHGCPGESKLSAHACHKMQNLDTVTLRMKDGEICAHTGILGAPECMAESFFTVVKCLGPDFPI